MDQHEWKVYRHYAGTKYFALLATIFAGDSDDAVHKLKEKIREQAGKWRAFAADELLILRRADADEAFHVVTISTDVVVKRVTPNGI